MSGACPMSEQTETLSYNTAGLCSLFILTDQLLWHKHLLIFQKGLLLKTHLISVYASLTA
jgi:hypothetical protein